MSGVFFSAKNNHNNEVEYLSTFAKSGEIIMTEEIGMALCFTSKKEAISWFRRFLENDNFIKHNYHDYAIVTVVSELIPHKEG